MAKKFLIEKIDHVTRVTITNTDYPKNKVYYNYNVKCVVTFDEIKDLIVIDPGNDDDRKDLTPRLQFSFDSLEDNFGATNYDELSQIFGELGFFSEGTNQGSLQDIIDNIDEIEDRLQEIIDKPSTTVENICFEREDFETINEEVIKITSYSSSDTPTYILGLTTIPGVGNTTPAAIDDQGPVYFNNPVEMPQGTTLEENGNQSYYFDIIQRYIDEGRAIGINFPDIEHWSYEVPVFGTGPGGINIFFYITKAEFADADDFLATYVGSITDTTDSNIYVRPISTTTSYTKYYTGTLTASLVKQFDNLGEEIVSSRKFYYKGQEIPEPTNYVEDSCLEEPLDLTTLQPKEGTTNIVDQLLIDGKTANLNSCSSISFVWGNDGKGSFILTNKVTNSSVEYTYDSGVTPNNSVDFGRFNLEDFELDATNATGLYLNVQGCRIEVRNSFCGSLANATQNTTLDLSSVISNGRSLAIGGDGTVLLANGVASDNLAKYVLSTPYDLSTATLDFAIGGITSGQEAFAISNDGVNFFETNIYGSIKAYTLSTPFDYNTKTLTGTYSSGAFGVGFWLSDDGTKFAVATFPGEVLMFDMSTPFDVTTATPGPVFPGTGFQLRGLDFPPDGSKLYVANSDILAVQEYDLSIPFDVSTAIDTGNIILPPNGFIEDVQIANGIVFLHHGSSTTFIRTTSFDLTCD